MKQEIIDRLNKVCEASQNARFTIRAEVRDWENYGKSRTYLKLVETSSETKHYKVVDYGYFDNVSGKYVAGDKRDLSGDYAYDFGGNNRVNF